MQVDETDVRRASDHAVVTGPDPTTKYNRTIQSVIEPNKVMTVDVYCVLRAFGISCPAQQHAIKKMLMPGKRGKGTFEQDMREAIIAIERAIQLNKGP